MVSFMQFQKFKKILHATFLALSLTTLLAFLLSDSQGCKAFALDPAYAFPTVCISGKSEKHFFPLGNRFAE